MHVFSFFHSFLFFFFTYVVYKIAQVNAESDKYDVDLSFKYLYAKIKSYTFKS